MIKLTDIIPLFDKDKNLKSRILDYGGTFTMLFLLSNGILRIILLSSHISTICITVLFQAKSFAKRSKSPNFLELFWLPPRNTNSLFYFALGSNRVFLWGWWHLHDVNQSWDNFIFNLELVLFDSFLNMLNNKVNVIWNDLFHCSFSLYLKATFCEKLGIVCKKLWILCPKGCSLCNLPRSFLDLLSKIDSEFSPLYPVLELNA